MSGQVFTSKVIQRGDQVEAHVWRQRARIHKYFKRSWKGHGRKVVEEAQAWAKDVGWNGKRAADKYK